MNEVVNINSSELKVVVFKLAVLLSMVLVLVAVFFSFIADDGKEIAISMLLISMALLFAANGILAVLKIIDWFEERAKRNG